MKWGVRRYQNADGTLTTEGRKRLKERNNVLRNLQYTDDVNAIVRSLSNKEKKLLGASLHEEWIEKDYENDILTNIAKTFVTKQKDTPISFIEIWTYGGDIGQIAIATRSGDEYRGKGYASKEVEKAIKWADRYGNKSIKELEWIAEKTNTGSNALAKKYGFEQTETPNTTDWENYNRYVRKTKK